MVRLSTFVREVMSSFSSIEFGYFSLMGPDVLFTYSLVWFPYVFKTLGCHNAREVELRLQKGLRFRFRESHELKVKI